MKKVIIPTNKTNGFVTIDIEEYRYKILNKLKKISLPINIGRIKKFKTEALELLDEYKLALSNKEFSGVKYQLDLYSIPIPKFLVKDHKP